MAQENRTNLTSGINTNLTGASNITSAEVRAELIDIIDSSFNLLEDNLDDIAEGSNNKAFTGTEKNKLAAIAAGAQVNTVASVNGHVGTVVVTASDVGLGNVNNTSDSNKPVSTATQTALNAKLENITSLIEAGDRITIGGSGTAVSPYVISADDTRILEINTQTDDYTLVLGDASKYVRINKATAVSLTVPNNSDEAFPIGTQIPTRAVGIGKVTFVADTGVTINTSETLSLRKQGSTGTLIKVATNEWDLTGDLEEA